MYQSYSLSRHLDGGEREYVTTFTAADDDAINCAHMLAAGFNTMSRNFMLGWAMGVVNTKAGTVQYDGRIEQIKRDEPWSADTATDDEVLAKASADLMKASAGKLARSVLEEAYVELQAVKAVLEDAGVETIPADAGVRDLLAVKRSMSAEIERRDVEIAEFVQRRANQNAAARDELIAFARGAYEELCEVDPEGNREDLQHRYRGMLDVLANLLVAIGEADRDEKHAVARRLVEKPED